jgi:hypothetical protein
VAVVEAVGVDGVLLVVRVASVSGVVPEGVEPDAGRVSS